MLQQHPHAKLEILQERVHSKLLIHRLHGFFISICVICGWLFIRIAAPRVDRCASRVAPESNTQTTPPARALTAPSQTSTDPMPSRRTAVNSSTASTQTRQSDQ